MNGYPIQTKPVLGIGLQPINIEDTPDIEKLINHATNTADLIYGQKRYLKKRSDARFVPAHVAYDKVVNCFHKGPSI